jgi:hypothetical protein
VVVSIGFLSSPTSGNPAARHIDESRLAKPAVKSGSALEIRAAASIKIFHRSCTLKSYHGTSPHPRPEDSTTSQAGKNRFASAATIAQISWK